VAPSARRGLGFALLLLTASGAAPLRAAEDDARAPSPAARLGRHLLESPRLLDAEGVRNQLDLLGVTLQLFYNQYLAWKPRGGVDTDSTTGSSGSYDFFTRVDAQELVGWPGLSMLLHVKGQYDDNVNGEVGALSDPIDDADFDEGIYVDELWLEQSLLSDRLRLRLGFLEAQTLYDRNAYANSEDTQFMNTSFDNDPLVPLPNGLGAALIANPTDGLALALGVADADNTPRHAGFDTAFDGVNSLDLHLEATLRTQLPCGERALPGALRLGAYRDGRRRTVFGRVDADGDPDTSRGHWGAWLSLDQAVTREDDRSEQGLGIFARVGYADEDVSRIEWFWSVGAAYLGPIPGRPSDVLGVAGYQGIASDRYQKTVESDFDGEAAIEVYYRTQVLPWLAVTPDFQYVFDPGGIEGTRDAIVTVLRLRVSF
jgi:porin